MRKTLLRVRILAAFAALIFFALVAPAFAQEAPADPGSLGLGEILGLIAVGLVGLYGIARDIISRMAAAPQVDGWDKAKETLDKLSPFADTLKRIADPQDPMVAPTPTNPNGTA